MVCHLVIMMIYDNLCNGWGRLIAYFSWRINYKTSCFLSHKWLKSNLFWPVLCFLIVLHTPLREFWPRLPSQTWLDTAYTSPPLDWPGAEHLTHNPRRLQAPQDTQQAERETAGCRRRLLHRCISTPLELHTSYSAPITKLLEQHANTPVRVHSHKWVLFLAVILAFWHLLLQYNTKYVSFNSSLTVPVYLLKIVGLVYSSWRSWGLTSPGLEEWPFLKLCILIHCAHNMKDFPVGSFEM